MEFYKDDLPCFVSFEFELDMWKSRWESEPQLACTVNTLGKALDYTDKDFYPTNSALLTIKAMIPITRYKCERC